MTQPRGSSTGSHGQAGAGLTPPNNVHVPRILQGLSSHAPLQANPLDLVHWEPGRGKLVGYTASQTGRRDPHTSTMEHKRPLPLHAEVSDLTTSSLSSPWGGVWSQLGGQNGPSYGAEARV